VHLSTVRYFDPGWSRLDQRHVAQYTRDIVDGDGFKRIGDAVALMGWRACIACVVSDHHNVARAHIDDRNAGLIFGMIQDKAFMLETADSFIVSDPPNLLGLIVVRVSEFEGESDGVPGGSAVVVFHGVCFCRVAAFLSN